MLCTSTITAQNTGIHAVLVIQVVYQDQLKAN